MSKEKLIPELRFPEFKTEGEWENKPLDNLCKLVRGPFGGALKKEIFVQKGYAVYEQSHAIYSDFNSFRYRIDEGKFSELKRFSVRASDLIMSCSGTMGKFALIPKNYEQGIINQALLKLTIKKGFDIWFVKISLETEHNQNKLLSQSAGGAIKNVVSVSQIKELELAVPKLPEQQKIASCLSSLDDLIAAHSQKLELLKNHKKGLMQNLFPQEGEKVPKYRFKEFEKDGEWLEKTVQEICDVNPSSNQLPFEFVYIDIESVENGNLKKENKIKLEGAPSRAQRLLKRNDVIYQMVRPYQMNNYYFQVESEIKYVASTGYAQLRAFESSEFLFQLIHTREFVGKVLAKCSGSNYPAINSSDLKLIDLQIPRNPNEQQQIASCLSSLDALIIAQEEKIEQLKLHKKGLMQGLFPTIND